MSDLINVQNKPLANFKPQETRKRLTVINAGMRYATKVKDLEMFKKAAEAKIAEVAELVAWWDTNVRDAGGDQRSFAAKPANGLSEAQAFEICGFKHQRISEWRNKQKSAWLAAMIEQFKLRSGLGGEKRRPAPPTRQGIAEDLDELIANHERFGTIYVDPPWLYDNQATRSATDTKYEGQTVEALCALPVEDIAADDAHLHLWTTSAFLFEAPRVIAAWGFEYKSMLVWCKSEIGIGNYWRNAHEIMLTAVRGNAKSFAEHNLRSWFECSRGKHSAKPEQVASWIERVSPAPWIELFATRDRQEWTVCGNRIEPTLFSSRTS